MIQSILWTAFEFLVNRGSALRRHWRSVLAATTMTIALTRSVIWVAKAMGSAASVDQALNLVGLGEYVLPFETWFDDTMTAALGWVLRLFGG